MKLMVIPVGRGLVFSGSQAINISYSTDHRQKIFRTLPQAAWFSGSQTKNISYSTDHRPLTLERSDLLGDWVHRRLKPPRGGRKHSWECGRSDSSRSIPACDR